MRVVVDPNVLVSSLIGRGVTAEIVDRWMYGGEYDIVVCPCLVDELADVLSRPKIVRASTGAARQLLQDALTVAGEWRDDPQVDARLTPDPDDDYLVALAIEAAADGIVSGDSDLQQTTGGVRVYRPREFLEELRRRAP